jgi:hypothetical protein
VQPQQGRPQQFRFTSIYSGMDFTSWIAVVLFAIRRPRPSSNLGASNSSCRPRRTAKGLRMFSKAPYALRDGFAVGVAGGLSVKFDERSVRRLTGLVPDPCGVVGAACNSRTSFRPVTPPETLSEIISSSLLSTKSAQRGRCTMVTTMRHQRCQHLAC